MPQVPRYGEPRVTRTALPGARRTAARTAIAEGAGVELERARTAETLAGVAGNVAENVFRKMADEAREERARADSIAITAAENRIQEWEARYLYGDGTDDNPGALSRRGKNALELPEEAGEAYRQLTDALGADMKTPEQQLAFEKLRLNRRANLEVTIRRHVAGQIQAYEANELQSKIENGTNAAIANALDPRRVQVELAGVVAAIRTHAPRLGAGAEAIELQVEAATTKVHTGVIGRLLANDHTRAAEIYFDEAKDQIKGEALEKVENAIAAGKLRQQAQQKSDEILAAGGTLTEQREKARAIDDPQLRDEVMRRLEHEDAVKKSEQRERHEQNYRQMFDIVERTPNLNALQRHPYWTELSGAERAGLMRYLEDRLRGVPTKTDPKAFYTLMDLAGTDPAKFATENLYGYRHRLSENDWQQLLNLQLQVRGRQTRAADETLTPFRTRTQVWDDVVTANNLDKDDEETARLRMELDKRVEQLQATTGKPLPNEEIQAIADDLIQPIILERGTWSGLFSSAPFSDVTKRGAFVTYDDIPTRERAKVEELLRGRKIPVTRDAVVAMYLRAKRILGEVK